MDDSWSWIEEELKKIQTELPADPEMMQVVDAISVADFWKRRYDEEMMLWEKKLQIKEEEKKNLQDQAFSHEMSIKELDWKLKELERRWEHEKLLLEDRLKAKEVEAELEKTKLQWESRLKEAETENKILKNQLGREAGVSVSPAAGVPGMEMIPEQASRHLRELEETLRKNEEEAKTRLEKLETEKKEVAQMLSEKEKIFMQEKEKWSKLEGEVSGMTGQMGMRLANLKEREQEHFTILEDLARGFAHRVRNYLGIMSGTVQLALANFKVEPELEEQLKVVDQNVQDMLRSIEDFLALARVPEMANQPLNINSLLEAANKHLESRITLQKISVTKNLAADIPQFNGDPKLMQESLMHLMENSIEAMPNGGQMTLTTLYDKAKDAIIVKITDTGSGISENHIKKVCQPYFSSKKNHKGLGLTAAKRIIDLHRSTLGLESVKDKGTTVTISLLLNSSGNGAA
ncbi:MAG: ATP-binding protein [Elusimicrobiota bacterium]